MQLSIPTTAPFSFAQSLAFIRRFPPCRGDYLIDDDSVTAAVAIDDRAYAFTLRDRSVDVANDTPGDVAKQLATRAADFIGASDDVRGFYELAETDAPMQRVVDGLYGLHHVRGLGRMDELPWSDRFARIARELYRRRVDHQAIAARYGRHIGYWSFYLMNRATAPA